MTRRRLVVLLSVAAALVVALGLHGAPAVLLAACFLGVGPGLGLTGAVRFPDRATEALTVIGVSLALAALVSTILIGVGHFRATTTVGVLAIVAVAGTLRRRPAAALATSGAGIAGARAPAPVVELDPAVPALLVRFGRYPNSHGSVAAARTLGRAGVPVDAIVETANTPLALSRYVDQRFVWPTTGREPEDELLAGLLRIGEQLDSPVVAVPSDDEAAVFLAEHAGELRPMFLLPDVDPELPRRLASKRGLAALCLEHAVPTPRTVFPTPRRSVKALTKGMTFPVVVKNVEAFRRLHPGSVPGTTVVADRAALQALLAALPDPGMVMVQEYLPPESCEDWIFHAYCDADAEPLVAFTGVKLRSWPPRAGVTTYARTVPNEELERLATRFLREISYRGIADLDFRFDRRDGRYKLVDCNPRMGAQFAVFATASGVDVVRALHLDLTGRAVPRREPAVDRAIRVEHLDLPALVAYRGGTAVAPDGAADGVRARWAWFAPDDLAPFGTMVVRVTGLAIARAARALLPRQRRRATAPASRGAAKSVPQTKRINGPKVAAAARPVKKSPGTEDSNVDDSTGKPSTRRTRSRSVASRKPSESRRTR